MRTRAFATAVFVLAAGLASSPASAQYQVPALSDPATGETYHVEVSGNLWGPTPNVLISSESLGIIGNEIDFVTDLGIELGKLVYWNRRGPAASRVRHNASRMRLAGGLLAAFVLGGVTGAFGFARVGFICVVPGHEGLHGSLVVETGS